MAVTRIQLYFNDIIITQNTRAECVYKSYKKVTKAAITYNDIIYSAF